MIIDLTKASISFNAKKKLEIDCKNVSYLSVYKENCKKYNE